MSAMSVDLFPPALTKKAIKMSITSTFRNACGMLLLGVQELKDANPTLNP